MGTQTRLFTKQTLLSLEVVVITLAALAFNSWMLLSPGNERLYGHETEWLTSSAHFAHLSLREYGYIPLWQPYNEFGEPLIDNPFSFVLNPLSAGPTLLFGGTVGIKLSVALYGIFAGLGGWFLARTLSMGALGRLLLGALMIIKGSMVAMIGMGFFQLGVAQAYFPWIVAAALLTLRRPALRWPVVLLAVLFTLLFWAGNIWYTLPTAFGLALLTLWHCLPGTRGRWDWNALRRMAIAAVLTLGLSAITFLPIFGNRDFIGRHLPEKEAGDVVDPLTIAGLFFDDGDALFREVEEPYYPQFYYSYLIPGWFALLLVFVLPPLGVFRSLQRASTSEQWRIVIPAVVMIVGCFIWGVGGNPLMIWLYDVVPGLARWRFVGRALAVAGFWLALLVTLRVDGYWKLLFDPRWSPPMPSGAWRALQVNLAALLSVVVGLAVLQAAGPTRTYLRTTPYEPHDSTCLQWLRMQFPDRELALWRFGYDVTTPFLDQRIRQIDIEADYAAVPMAATLGTFDLTRSLPEFGIGWYGEEGDSLDERGYREVPDSLRSMGRPCLYRLTPALGYAYAISLNDMSNVPEPLDPALTIPVSFQRLPDRIRVYAEPRATQTMIVTVQERAYPGWQVTVDGMPAQLESVGGQIGVALAMGQGVREITFEYRPPLLFIGGGITLLTWAACIAYLLRRPLPEV